MNLIKGKRKAYWIPYDADVRKQTVRGSEGKVFCYVEFDGTKEEVFTASRLARPFPRHRAWVNLANLESHGGV